MFAVDETSAASIRRAYEESGELAAVVELRRIYPLIQRQRARRVSRTHDRQLEIRIAAERRSPVGRLAVWTMPVYQRKSGQHG